MRRFALAVLLGVVATWSVAWGLAFEDAPSHQLACRLDVKEVTLIVQSWEGFGVTVVDRLDVARLDGLSPFVTTPEDITPWYLRTLVLRPIETRNHGDSGIFLDARGWPLRSLCSIHEDPFQFHHPRAWGINMPAAWNYRLGFSDSERVALPLRPICMGFAIDVAFYAALAWIGLYGVRTVVHSRRKRRGCCDECGYDLKGTSTGMSCPECGLGGAG